MARASVRTPTASPPRPDTDAVPVEDDLEGDYWQAELDRYRNVLERPLPDDPFVLLKRVPRPSRRVRPMHTPNATPGTL